MDFSEVFVEWSLIRVFIANGSCSCFYKPLQNLSLFTRSKQLLGVSVFSFIFLEDKLSLYSDQENVATSKSSY